jgi:hypothetical protein
LGRKSEINLIYLIIFLSRVDEAIIVQNSQKKKGGDFHFFPASPAWGNSPTKPKGLVKLDFLKARNEGYLERG